MQHISQDWKHKRLMILLESALVKEKAYVRDAWLNYTTLSAMTAKEPLAKNMPHTRAFQRKLAVYRYNQHGMLDREMWRIPENCHSTGIAMHPGTRDYVPWLNINNFSMSYATRQGMIMGYRVKLRGYGTCKHLDRGAWAYRYFKCHERDVAHLTRA